jgi:adenine-specific DNA glycosylase
MTDYPVKKGKTKVVPIHLHYAVVRKHDLFFVVTRPEQGIWAGLFDFPSVENEDKAEALSQLARRLQLKNVSWVDGKPLSHVLSHRKITAYFHETICDFIPTESGVWKSAEELVQIGVSALLKKYVQSQHM